MDDNDKDGEDKEEKEEGRRRHFKRSTYPSRHLKHKVLSIQ